jgi:hypothetical protein
MIDVIDLLITGQFTITNNPNFGAESYINFGAESYIYSSKRNKGQNERFSGNKIGGPYTIFLQMDNNASEKYDASAFRVEMNIFTAMKTS